MLQLTEGPQTGGVATRWRIDQSEVLVIGRGQEARVQLPDPSISRRHAEIGFDGLGWFLRDLGSRHGTVVNARVVTPGTDMPLQHRDEIQFGPWFFKVLIPTRTDKAEPSTGEDGPATRVRRVLPSEMGTLVRRRLDLVLQSAEAFGKARSEDEIARSVVEAVIEGAGSSRVALVRVGAKGQPGEVMASGGRDGGSADLPNSLLSEAARGATVLLEADAPSRGYGQSIADLGIHSAFCAPVRVGDRVEAVLYLDARGGEISTPDDAVAFVSAMARMCGLGLSNLNRASLERQQAQLETDLAAARVAQRIMMPPNTGRIADVQFATLSRAGRFVAGDLIGVEPRPEGGVYFYVGDVTGKGAGAAMVMGIAQSYLSAALTQGAGILQAVDGLNRLLTPRMEMGQFISLWIGDFCPVSRKLRSLDAGHGYALLREADKTIRNAAGSGGFPIGIDATAGYEVGECVVPADATLLIFSDGLVEQASPGGDRFGLERVRRELAREGNPERVVAALEDELTRHAGGARFDDDLTMGAFRLG